MQAIFAFDLVGRKNFANAEKSLTNSIQDFYKLFLYLFSILPELKHYREKKIENLKEKLNPSEEDLNPNRKFINNLVIAQIEENSTLKKLLESYKISWENHPDLIVSIYNEMIKSDFFETYMANRTQNYEEDKRFVLQIIATTFANSELLHWFLSEQNVHWTNDYNDALLMLYRNIEIFKESHGNTTKIFPLWKDEIEDKKFYKDLFLKTTTKDSEYQEIIEKKLQNWDFDRLINIDIILIKMAICELLEFPTIPIKVTLNEYIELAKNYSSNKSGTFVNGMLDKIIADFRNEDKIKKIGRGLIN